MRASRTSTERPRRMACSATRSSRAWARRAGLMDMRSDSRRISSHVLALDVGTSSVRALLFDQRARQVPGAVVQIPYQPRITPDGGAEVDSHRLAGLVLRAIRQLLTTVRQSSPTLHIAAVGSSTFWHSLVAADDSGQALTPVYLWADSRSWQEAEELRNSVDSARVR